MEKRENVPFDESNLDKIGSAEDHAAKHAAAELETQWVGAGKEVGVMIWRVENTHEDGVANFGINAWPKRMYGQFYTGDSYIVLSTTEEEGGNELLFDIFFWIGTESSQDEYGVAAYKACELDDLLGDAPIQHREVQNHESTQFLDLFKDKNLNMSINYLIGGIDGGFQEISELEEDKTLPTRMFHIRRTNRHTRCVQVPVECSSLNQGDAFVLDAGEVIYTWFGTSASGFEKQQAGLMSHNLADDVNRPVTKQESDVDDDNEEFWTLLGGKKEIMEEDDKRIIDVARVQEPAMFKLSDDNNELQVDSVPFDKESLHSEDVCLIDIGTCVFVWVGNGSTKREQQEAMRMAQTYFTNNNTGGTTNVLRIKEGQEARARGWPL